MLRNSFQIRNNTKGFEIASNKNKTDYLLNITETLNSSITNTQTNTLDNIIKLMLSETETNETKFEFLLDFHIKKNPKIKNDIIEKIMTALNANTNLYYKVIIVFH